ncbi:PLP-dependent aminotransferase family protein [Soehngenia longivitae]|uniref:PLP-dependent aminotransferase family protein n=1 Tax=Soehngenia longivitae TaxID=2562294 RepID=A0A4Z0D7A9_9FIRM|nr:PLP-dependent aminotransferase family protein [Soehngenia longivitae]TFZ40773.1 PLP-dependent aminotransferase family protein [Soehngenia longivitae]
MVKFADRILKIPDDPLNEIMKLSSDRDVISFSLGSPSKEAYPTQFIINATNKLLTEDPVSILSYGLQEGYVPLRKNFIEHIAKKRNINAKLENVLITTGATQGIELVSQTFIQDGDVVLVESPTFFAALPVFKKYGATVIPVKMDYEGIDLNDLETKLKKYNPKLLYIIPTFQNPTGISLSKERRIDICELADKYKTVILEDDPYYDLRFIGEPVLPIKSFDKYDNVIYLSSFSKILAPGLRVGVIVANKEIVEKLVLAKSGADTNTSLLSQGICSEFLESGFYESHLTEIFPLYLNRLNKMVDCIEQFFPENIQMIKPEGGLFIWLGLPNKIDTQALLQISSQKYKVSYVPGSIFFINQSECKNYIRLNFSSNDESTIELGMKRLSMVFKDYISGLSF